MSTSETQDEKDRENDEQQEPGSDSAPTSVRDPLGPILDSFLARFRKGERPSLTEYIGRYPALADEIRELFPALVEIEQLGSLGGAAAQAGGPSSTAPYDPAALAAAAGGRASPWPERLGDYRILDCIGEGGMGVVYEAVRESLRSHVALKVMHPRFRASAEYLRRFHNEARSAAQLHHTNIVSVFDYGEHDGVFYYAMQFIAGHSLDQILADVRRLRSNPGQAKAAPAEAGSFRNAKGSPAPTRSVRGAAQTEAASDPLMQTVVHGLFTGQFALGGGVAFDLERTPLPATEPIAPGLGSILAMTHDPALEPGLAQAPASAPANGKDRNHRESGTGSSSSSLAGQGEDRYHREVARLAAQVAEALAYAHKRGVLHRDIKPSNLLLDAVGNVWVTDFGLAKFEAGEDLSHSQDVVGTLRYMAPERFRGVSDRRCDIYALGATLYELLTLRPLFESADKLRLIDHVVQKPPAPPRELDHRIPRDLETIVLKALAKDPNDRFATADELAAELRRFLENRPIRSRAISASERLWRWCKRNPVLAGLNALAATLTTAIAIVSTVLASTYYGQRNEVQFEQRRTNVNLARAERAEHEARLALGQSLVSEGAALQRTGLLGQRFDSLDRLGRAAKVLASDSAGRKRLPEIRNHAIAALGLTDIHVRREQDYGLAAGINVDPALERYALGLRSGEIVVRRLGDDRELVRLPALDWTGAGFSILAFSPDGELLVSCSGGQLRVWHLGRREVLGSLQNRAPVVFHPDGHRMLFGPLEGGVGVWDREKREVVRRLPLGFAPNNLALDPAGRRFAVNSSDLEKPRVAIVELESGRVLFEWRSEVGNGAMAWSADGQLLAVGGPTNDPRVYVWKVSSGTLASVLRGHTGAIVGAQFAHTGYLLATTAWDGTIRLWDAALGEPLAIAPGVSLGFSPDDHRMAFLLGAKIGVLDVATGVEARTLNPGMLGNRSEARDATGVMCADFSPDGRLLATGDGNGVRLWETDGGRELAHLKAGRCDTVLFHADGQSLVSAGPWGLYRWPIRIDRERGPDAIMVGPPELIRETEARGPHKAAWLPDHRTLALTDNEFARVLLIDSGHPHPAWSRRSVLSSGENRRMTTIAVSPDGRWLAVGGWYEAGVRVWDLRMRRLEHTLRPKAAANILRPKDAINITKFFIGFSSDGRWLVSSTHPDAGDPTYDFWRVGTWEFDHRINQERGGTAGHPPVFTGDGRMMALAIGPDQVMLADTATGRELARLTILQPLTPTPIAFSGDGTKLVANTNSKTALVWDLRLIRDRLMPMGLDWEAPPFPAAPEKPEATGPLPAPRAVRVSGEVIEPQARRTAELAEMNRRIAANPDDAEALIHRGWLFTMQKKGPEAIADLEHFLRLRPDDADAFWLLGKVLEESKSVTGVLSAFGGVFKRAINDRDARFQHGLLALALGQPDLALEDFSPILSAEPELDPARYRRALALFRLGRHREALADLDILIRKHPDDNPLYELRGIVRDAVGDHEQARADREKARSLLPNDPRVLKERAWASTAAPNNQRDQEWAIALARRAVATAPGQPVSLNTLGVVLYRAGRYAEAISVLDQSLAAGKGEFDGIDLFVLAMARQKQGDASQARACFDQAVRWWGQRKSLPAQYISDLTAFRAESEGVLADSRAELPADVFAPR